MLWRLGGSKGVVDVTHDRSQLIQERVVAVHLNGRQKISRGYASRIRMPHLLQKFHILAAHSSLTEFQHSMGGGRVVQHNLEDLRAEEIGQGIGSLIHDAVLLGSRERRRGCIIIARYFVSIGERAVTLHKLQALTAVWSRITIHCIVTCAILDGNVSFYQRHPQQQCTP